jgi:hypothetical protein
MTGIRPEQQRSSMGLKLLQPKTGQGKEGLVQALNKP